MARGPQITEAAERSLLPSARYNVRSAGAADFGGAEAAGLQQLARGADDLGASITDSQLAAARIKRQDARQLRNFTLDSDLIQFAADEESALEEAKQNMPSGGWEFQKGFVLGHGERAQAWMERNGLDEREQAAYAPRLTQLRTGLSSNALGTEFAERNRFYGEQTRTSLDTLKTGINTNPDAYEASVALGEQTINATGLPPAQKDSLLAAWRREASAAYGQAVLQRDPSALIEGLGGPVTQAGDYTGNGAANDAEKHIFERGRASGMSGVAAAAFAGTFSHEGAGANPNARNPGDGADGSDSIGIGQWNGARATALKAFAQARGVPWNTVELQTEFALHELKTAEPEAYRRLLAAQTVEQAVEAMNYYERPQGWRNGGDPEKVAGWSDRVSRATRIAGTPATETRPPAGALDPRLANMAYEDRINLMGAAQRGVQQQVQAAAAAQQEQHNTWLNDFTRDVLDGKKGAEDIQLARESGQLTDVDEIARVNNIVEQRAAQNVDINTFDNMFNTPGTVWNAFDPNVRKAVDAGFARNPTVENLQAIVTRTGIVPPAAASMIRGQLLSTDPAVVGQSAGVAANILAQNPNAFSGIEGARDVEEAGSMYNHLVNDLGFNAAQASERIAKANDPSVPGQQRLTAEGATTFRNQVTRRMPLGSIISEINGNQRARIMSTEQEALVQQDYADLALDHFQRHGDQRAAEAWAKDRIKSLYGISNGTLTKYPPEHVYPAVAGSHDWLYGQAAAAVNRDEPGVTVEPGSVYLVPAPLTAEAWRRGAPAPYSIHFTYMKDGQRVYDNLPGSYTFDPARAQGAAQTRQAAEDERRFRAREERLRGQREAPLRQPMGAPVARAGQ